MKTVTFQVYCVKEVTLEVPEESDDYDLPEEAFAPLGWQQDSVTVLAEDGETELASW